MSGDLGAGDPALSRQYEAYPYPERNPADEDTRLITGSPSHLDELNHYVFAGRLDFAAPFRVLVAGGGTGDGLVMLAQHCADAGIAADITYLDLSAASRAVAEARMARRGLTARFVTGSLLAVADAAPGPYDYIDCCGVLHHLPDPAAGLVALTAQLAPGGGIGVMLYGAYGRTGVYPLQSALRRLAGSEQADADRVALAESLVRGLPPTNWFVRNPLLGDHRSSPAGLYDLLLHARDRAYTVGEAVALAEGAGLSVTAFVPPVRYDPALFLSEPRLRARASKLAPLDAAALAEELSGTLKTHVFYAVRPERAGSAIAAFSETARPVLRDLEAPAFAQAFRPGNGLTVDLDGHRAKLPLPPLAGALVAAIDGTRSFGEIADHCRAGRSNPPDRDAVLTQCRALAATLTQAGKLYLRAPAIP